MVKTEKDIDQLWTEFTHLLQNGKRDSYPEFFYYYCRHILDRATFEKYILNLKYLFELGDKPIAGSKILDVGCGFGIDSIIMAANDAQEVNGIDVNEDWVRTIKTYMKDLNWDLPIKPKVGDASHLAYPDDTFDVLLSVEAISHYRDVDSFIKEAHRVLQKGGTLIISDGNNGANPLIRRKTYDIWNRFENGPTAESFHGHQIKKCYVDMRREIISEAFPELRPEEVRELARNTFGMGRDQILKVTQTYMEDGTMPASKFRRGIPAFNPEKNDYIERLFDPRKLGRQMEEIGFKVKVYAHFGGAGEKNFIGKLNSVLRFFSPLTILGARAFKIVGVK